MRTWQIDPTHSNVEFAVRHLMISTVRGRFGAVTGTVNIDDKDPRKFNVDVEIDVGSIDTRQEQRDAHLRSADFFDVANHPKMTFRSNRADGDLQRQFKLIGDLTIRGVTRPVTMSVTNEGSGKDPWGNDRLGFSATAKIDRSEFGLTWNQALEAGGVMVGDEVKISLDIELTSAAVAAAA